MPSSAALTRTASSASARQGAGTRRAQVLFPLPGRAAQQHAAAVERQQRSVQDQQLPSQQQREEAVPDDALQRVEFPQQRLIPGFVQEYLHPVRRSHPGREPVCPENRPGRGGSEFLPFRERPGGGRTPPSQPEKPMRLRRA